MAERSARRQTDDDYGTAPCRTMKRNETEMNERDEEEPKTSGSQERKQAEANGYRLTVACLSNVLSFYCLFRFSRLLDNFGPNRVVHFFGSHHWEMAVNGLSLISILPRLAQMLR